MPGWKLEKSVEGIVVGVDEVGCAPLAGPVVAAAVVLDRKIPRRLARRIDDSKKVPAEEREEIFARLPDHAQIGVGEASVDEIEQLNILRAAQLAMRRAVDMLGSIGVTPALIIVDGNRLPGFGFPTQCVVGGDGISLSIAAASIVAKVTRDRQMRMLAEAFPGYGWERNVGYPTAEHRAAIQRLGLTPHHRRTFRAVSEVLATNYCFDFIS
jgi:ribonuclease HII